MNEIVKLWTATDDDSPPVTCELNRVDASIWTLDMVEGPFSGYPAIELNRQQLKGLRDAIDAELMTEEG